MESEESTEPRVQIQDSEELYGPQDTWEMAIVIAGEATGVPGTEQKV